MGNFINMMEELAVNECDPEAIEFLNWDSADCGCVDSDAVEDTETTQAAPATVDTEDAHRKSRHTALDDLVGSNTATPVSDSVECWRRSSGSGSDE